MKRNTTVPGDQPDADSGSRNRELSTAAKDAYKGALKASGANTRNTPAMDAWVRRDNARTDESKEHRAQLVKDLRGGMRK